MGCVVTYSETINSGTPPPTADTLVSYALNTIASPLTATGTNLLWHTTITDTGSIEAPVPSTSLPGITSYYVSQTIAGCKSIQTKIDVEVSAAFTYRFIGNGNWTDINQWENGVVPPDTLTTGTAIFIDPITEGKAILDTPVIIPAGCSLIVAEGKNFEINGYLTIEQ